MATERRRRRARAQHPWRNQLICALTLGLAVPKAVKLRPAGTSAACTHVRTCLPPPARPMQG
eukprot:9902610-Alexandrium_andersonii.AAC.1